MRMEYNREIYDAYDDMLDSCYEDVAIFGVPRAPSVVFKIVDPIMYEIGLHEYLDDLMEDGLFCPVCEYVGEKDCYCEEEEE